MCEAYKSFEWICYKTIIIIALLGLGATYWYLEADRKSEIEKELIQKIKYHCDKYNGYQITTRSAIVCRVVKKNPKDVFKQYEIVPTDRKPREFYEAKAAKT